MITFYDLTSTRGNDCSPNTWKVRLCLNYKGLQYRTVWLEFPDIAATCKELGIPPTSTLSDGQPYYTVPAIVDISEDDSKPRVAMAESYEIARYLDAAYPDTPRVTPEGDEEANEFQKTFAAEFRKHALLPLAPVYFPSGFTLLNPPSREHILYERAKEYGLKSMEDIRPSSKDQEEQVWEAGRQGWEKMSRDFYAQTDEGGPWLLGANISFGDFVVVAVLISLSRVWGEDGSEWKRVREWDSGRWGKIYDNTSHIRYEI
jgi:glutathione S-transferase